MPRIPGIGFIGLGQMDAANQLVFSKAFGTGRNGAKKRSTRKGARRSGSRNVSRSRKRKSGKRLVKGSAAAKRRMAKLRRMRK